jgi:hypothetical protein
VSIWSLFTRANPRESRDCPQAAVQSIYYQLFIFLSLQQGALQLDALGADFHPWMADEPQLNPPREYALSSILVGQNKS